MKKPRIKLMAEYYQLALWWADDRVGSIDPAELPISQLLRDDISSWAKKYHNSLNWDSPAESVGFNETDRAAFEAEGRTLWQRLSRELPDYDVMYLSQEGRLLHKLP